MDDQENGHVDKHRKALDQARDDLWSAYRAIQKGEYDEALLLTGGGAVCATRILGDDFPVNPKPTPQ